MDRNFKNEVFSGYRPYSVRTCNNCGKKPSTVLTMLNPINGHAVRMSKCECGEQTWSEDKE
jgi:hypothetical protein